MHGLPTTGAVDEGDAVFTKPRRCTQNLCKRENSNDLSSVRIQRSITCCPHKSGDSEGLPCTREDGDQRLCFWENGKVVVFFTTVETETSPEILLRESKYVHNLHYIHEQSLANYSLAFTRTEVLYTYEVEEVTHRQSLCQTWRAPKNETVENLTETTVV